MDTIVAIAVAVGLWKGQAAPPPKPPQVATVEHPAPRTSTTQTRKPEWPLGF
jgi:hypothetical protein